MTRLETSLVELWHHRATLCCLSPATGAPPFVVAIYEHDALIIRRDFETHNDAVTFAVDTMRSTIQPHLERRLRS